MAAIRQIVDEGSRSARLTVPARFQSGAFASNVGTCMQRTAQDGLVFSQLIHHDASALGLVVALQFGPPLLPAPGKRRLSS
jgi:hypothetical protein